MDTAGNLYGTTTIGGAYTYGAVFELMPTSEGWTEKVLHSFNKDGKDGYQTYANLVLDGAGNLYGTTDRGGVYNDGTVFELLPVAGGSWTEKILHNFGDNSKDGTNPEGGLIFDATGKLYGTTVLGGVFGYGTVFYLTPRTGGGWTEEILHSFNK
jgi:uncharacterized repeat protein (TIGR03803 family)